MHFHRCNWKKLRNAALGLTLFLPIMCRWATRIILNNSYQKQDTHKRSTDNRQCYDCIHTDNKDSKNQSTHCSQDDDHHRKRFILLVTRRRWNKTIDTRGVKKICYGSHYAWLYGFKLGRKYLMVLSRRKSNCIFCFYFYWLKRPVLHKRFGCLSC